MRTTDRDRLDGRRALVTGGSKGSGRAVVERLREMGADVWVTARTMPEKEEHPDRFVAADTSTPEGTDAVAARIAAAYGRQEPWEDSPPGWPRRRSADDQPMRRDGRPTAQWSRAAAGRSDDLTPSG